ncbi:MAG: alpha-L-fucosidase, partial [Kiritimatiellales bacterium]|nr:alpha-L-fucosidase [Kiritimatiellales bacterium]
ITFKRESLYKEEAVPDYEGGDLIETAPYKWQTHSSISGWFHRAGEKAAPSFRLFNKIFDVVSKNGNLLLNLALKADGSIRDDELAFLKDMEQWMNVVGESIHATRPWLTYGELDPGEELFFKEKTGGGVYDDPERIRMGHLRPYDGNIRYTRSKDGSTVYAARMSFPETPFTLRSFGKDAVGKDVQIKSITLLGNSEKIRWKRTDAGIEIKPPSKKIFPDDKWPVVFKLNTI